LIFSILPNPEKAKTDRILQYFSYQTVSRVVTGTHTGNRVQIKEIQSVSFSLIHSVLHDKERLYNS
jgi:hypothetical protein